jgi:hypothetical protein
MAFVGPPTGAFTHPFHKTGCILTTQHQDTQHRHTASGIECCKDSSWVWLLGQVTERRAAGRVEGDIFETRLTCVCYSSPFAHSHTPRANDSPPDGAPCHACSPTDQTPCLGTPRGLLYSWQHDYPSTSDVRMHTHRCHTYACTHL